MTDDEGPLYTTKTGKVLTEADIERLAEEAERGYAIITCPRCGMTSANQTNNREER